MIIIKIILILLAIFLGLFLLSLVVYFFNLDMKLSAKLIPFMNKHYDKIKRKSKL